VVGHQGHRDKWASRPSPTSKAARRGDHLRGPPELQKRPDGLPGFKKNYDLDFHGSNRWDAVGR